MRILGLRWGCCLLGFVSLESLFLGIGSGGTFLSPCSRSWRVTVTGVGGEVSSWVVLFVVIADEVLISCAKSIKAKLQSD